MNYVISKQTLTKNYADKWGNKQIPTVVFFPFKCDKLHKISNVTLKLTTF